MKEKNNLYSNLVNFYNVNDENFIQFMSDIYEEMLNNHRDVEYVKEHLNDEISKILDKYLIDGKFNINIGSVVDDFLKNGLAENKVVTDIKKNIEECNLQIDDIAYNKDYSNNSVLPIYDKPIISFVIDDGSKAYVNMFQSVFEENNIKPTLAIISDLVDTNGYFTLSQLKDYKNKGYEIVGHSATHSADIYKNNGNENTVSGDLKKCHDFLKENGFNTEVIVYPWGNFSNPNFYKNIARKYFNIGINAVATHIINNKIPDTMYLERLFIQKTKYNLEQIKEKIDYAKNNNGWLIFGLHTNNNECDTQFLKDIIDYIKLNNIEIKNISDGFKIKGNKLSVGEYDDIRSTYMNMKGEMKNGFNIIPWIESKYYGIDKTPQEYENGITLLNIHPDNNNGIPCTLLNFKADNPDFYFQMKKDHNSNNLYLRYWDNTNHIWSEFGKIEFGKIETFDLIERPGYSSDVRTNIQKTNNVLHCSVSLVNSTKTGVFTNNTVLCRINKVIDTSFKTKIVPCIVTTGDGKIKYGALNIDRDTSDGKIRIMCHGSLDDTNIRWIDTEFTIIE